MLWVVCHPRRVLAAALFALLACVIFANLYLGLSTNQDELFNTKVAFFGQYLHFTDEFPENQASYVMIEPAKHWDAQKRQWVLPAVPPPTKDWIALADAITERLKNDTAHVKAVDSHVPLEQLGSQGILFEDPAQVRKDLTDFESLSVPFRPANILNKRYGSFPIERFWNAFEPGGLVNRKIDAQSADFAVLMANGMTAAIADPNRPIRLGDQVPNLTKLGQTDPSKLGYYYVPDQENPANHLLLIKVFERSDFTKRDGLADAIQGIRDDIQAASKNQSEFQVDLTGRPALEADEMSTTDHDARTSEIAALTAVFVGLVLMMRSLWVAVAAEFALLVGIGWTFGWATVSVHRLNLLSLVFLIALTGIGMDYLIQVLTRYRRESARRSSPRGIWTGVFKYVAAPINTACLGAAGAFLVSMFTNFRGAAELGIVAGGGLLLCLLTCYVILPPLLTLFPAKPRPQDAERSRHPDEHLQPTTIAPPPPQSRWRNLWLAPPVVWAVLLLIGIPFAREAKFDPGLLKMQAQSLPSVQLVHKLQTWSAAVLTTPGLDTAEKIAQLRAVRKAVQNLPTVEGTDSIVTAFDNDQWLRDQQAPEIGPVDYEPVRPQDLPALTTAVTKLAAAARDSKPPFSPMADSLDSLAKTIASAEPTSTAPAAARLTLWQQVFIQQLKDLLAPFRPAPFDPAKLPASLRSHYIGQHGQFVIYINPKKDLWHQSNLRDFVVEVESAVANIPNPPPVTGIAVNVYHSTSDIEKSFYEATAYALALIFLLVLIDLRNIAQTLLAISVLAMGLPMLIALMGLFHIDWNFANFFGLPILIGAGHEYGVFMVHRYNEARRDPHRRWRAWDVSDKALLLCGYVTSVSFGFFWLLGHHEGLKSLGLVMALGTTCIYLATLCVLRPLLLWKLGKRATAAHAFPVQTAATSLPRH